MPWWVLILKLSPFFRWWVKFYHDFVGFHAIDACERATGDALISTRWLRSDALF